MGGAAVTWAKFCDGFLDHPKVLRAGEDASNLFMRGCIWCNKHLTDGAIPREALRALTARRDAAALAAKLVSVRLWEETADGWQVHDWSDHNPTRESVEGRREKTREKVASWREKRGNSAGNAACNHGCNPVTCEECNPVRNPRGNPVSNPAPVPTRPDPSTSQDTKTLSPAAVAPSVLPSAATVTTLALDLGEPTAAPKPAKTKRTPKPADPPPFGIGDAFEALASSAGGRFAAGLDGDWTKGVRIAVAKSARQYPDLAAWRLVGEWLAAGGDRFRGVLGPSWAASTALADAMARAREWDATGRPALAGAPANSGQTLSHGPDAWSSAAKRNGVAL